MVYIVSYLVAIILANLIIAIKGPSAAIWVAFIFIGLDLTARDKLHEAWHHRNLFTKMATLIAIGSILSWLMNRNAGQIALASFIAFASAATIDTLAYHLLYKRNYIIKVNGSNVLSAAVDSMIFPAIAFGFPLLINIMLFQFIAKTAGGFIWSLLLNMVKKS